MVKTTDIDDYISTAIACPDSENEDKSEDEDQDEDPDDEVKMIKKMKSNSV